MKKALFSLMTAAVLFTAVSCASNPAGGKEIAGITTTFDRDEALKDTGKVPMKDMTGIEIAYDMTTGWNLGNTFDAEARGLGAETAWGQPKTTRAMIDGLARSGIKSIRIPVSWHFHNLDKEYTVDSDWTKRVKEVVDWAIEDGMYVILNVHHDNYGRNSAMPYGGGYYPNELNKDESLKFLVNTWAQIALAFNNGYDEHLVFETLNEPRLRGTPQEWNFSSSNPITKEAQQVINEFNQAIVDTIRASGGNNANRLILVPGYACTPAVVLSSDFVVPLDPANKVGVAVHMYSPYPFAMDPKGPAKYQQRMAQELNTTFKSLEAKYVKKGIPVVIGEYGATNKDNLEDRCLWFNTFIRQTRKMGIPCFLWDNNVPYKDSKGYEEKYGFYNRREQKWYFPEITETIIEAVK